MIKRTICAVMVLLIALASLTACSSGKSARSDGKTESGQSWRNRQGERGVKDSGAQNASASGSQTQIIGKVTSIVGNEVELDVGTMSSDTGSASKEFASSGETKTLLIPVGLSLTGAGTTTGAGAAGTGAETGAAGGGVPTGGGTAARGTTAGRSGTGTSTGKSTSAKSASTAKTTAGTAAAGSTLKRTSGFSSITQGMILRISQKEINGTLTVVKVAVVSK